MYVVWAFVCMHMSECMFIYVPIFTVWGGENWLPASSSLRLSAATAYWWARQIVCLTGCCQSWTLQQGWSAIVESMTMWHHCSMIFYTGFRCSTVSTINLPCLSADYKSLHGAAPEYLKSYCVGVSTLRARLQQKAGGEGQSKSQKDLFRRSVSAIAPFPLPDRGAGTTSQHP